MSNKVALVVLDGYGIGKDYKYNAVTQANSPFLKDIFAKDKISQLDASGTAVGLPENTMGGSEVGHYTLGAGRIVNQALHRIDEEIKDGSFSNNARLLSAIKENTGALHLVGMISNAGVHSHINHLEAILELVSKHSPLTKIFLHAITDGRDVGPKTACEFIDHLNNLGQKYSNFKTISCIGRYYAMDRDKNMERTQKAFDMIYNSSPGNIIDFESEIQEQYKNNLESDYYLDPIISSEYQKPTPEDLFLFFNFRTDRAAQLSNMIVEHNPLITFGDYCETATNIFENPTIKNHLGEYLSKQNLSQLRVAETEKYAHVTFFFNAQVKQAYPKEERIVVESKKIANYKDNPAMSASNITTETINFVSENEVDFVLVNYANPDLVGHSGSFEATKQAIEHIDAELQKLSQFLLEKGYSILVTADHGNAEEMMTENGEPMPSHTTNPVPFTILSNNKYELKQHGGLQDVAPTVIELLGLQKPEEMTGISLINN